MPFETWQIHEWKVVFEIKVGIVERTIIKLSTCGMNAIQHVLLQRKEALVGLCLWHLFPGSFILHVCITQALRGDMNVPIPRF